MTILDAVNELLRAVRTAPVNSIESGNVRAALAEDALNTERRKVCALGWWFNQDRQVTLTPNASQQIVIPSTYLKVDKYDIYDRTVPDITVRGALLYNKTDKDFTFAENIDVNVTYLIDWEDLPYEIQNMVTKEAKITFVENTLDPSAVTPWMVEELREARALANQVNAQNSNFNMLTGNDTTFDIVNRRRNRRRRL